MADANSDAEIIKIQSMATVFVSQDVDTILKESATPPAKTTKYGHQLGVSAETQKMWESMENVHLAQPTQDQDLIELAVTVFKDISTIIDTINATPTSNVPLTPIPFPFKMDINVSVSKVLLWEITNVWNAMTIPILTQTEPNAFV